ncbi:MAG: J domain-containing protein [Pseudomonadota bacterium]
MDVFDAANAAILAHERAQQYEASRQALLQQLRAERQQTQAAYVPPPPPPRRPQPPPPLPEEPTPYTVLGVTPDAPDFVVQAAYRAMAKRHHSDAGGNDKAMAKINEAYEAIKRKRGMKI